MVPNSPLSATRILCSPRSTSSGFRACDAVVAVCVPREILRGLHGVWERGATPQKPVIQPSVKIQTYKLRGFRGVDPAVAQPFGKDEHCGREAVTAQM